MTQRRGRGWGAALGLPLLAGCTGLNFLSDRCEVEVVAVTWPVEIRRGEAVTTATLTSAVSRATLSAPEYEQLRGALVSGTLSLDVGVVWNVPAFGGSGGVVLAHRAVLPPPGTAAVEELGEFPGWGVGSPPALARAAVRTPAAATVTGGTLEQLESSPSRYRITLEGREADGTLLRIRGDAAFSTRVERRACY